MKLIINKKIFVLTLLLFSALFLITNGIARANSDTTLIEVKPPIDGRVVSSPAGIDCPGDCVDDFVIGTKITLTSTPPKEKNTHWGGTGLPGCEGIKDATIPSNKCTFIIPKLIYDSKIDVWPTYMWKTYVVTVDIIGDGQGIISSSPASMNCANSRCTGIFGPAYVTAKLTAVAKSGSKFVGWETKTDGSYALCAKGIGDLDKGGFSKFTINTSIDCLVTVWGISDTSRNYGPARAKFVKVAESSTPPAPAANTSAPSAITTPAAKTRPVSPPIKVSLNGEVAAKDTPTTFTSGENVSISGVSVPGAKISLYIFSTPKTATVTADKNGFWSYYISGLESGDHRIEAVVSDPKTKQNSKREIIAKFTIVEPILAAPKIATILETETKTSYPYLISASIAVIAGILVIAWYLYKRRHNLAQNKFITSINQANDSGKSSPE